MRLTKAQKELLREHGKFCAKHAGHWMMAFVFSVIGLSLVYLLFANDQVFASSVYQR